MIALVIKKIINDYVAGVGAVVIFVSSVVSGLGVIVGTATDVISYGMNASALAGDKELF